MKVENKKNFTIYLGVLILSLFLLNYVSRNFYGRFDLTDNQMFTISESTKAVLDDIDDLLIMKAYFSADLPAELSNNKRYLQDLLEEYRAVNNEYIDFEFYASDDEEKFKTEAQKSGIQPVQLNVIENDKRVSKLVCMGLVIMYGDKKESIPVIQTTTGLEYDITTRIKKLVDFENETIAIVKTNNQKEIKNENITHILRQHYNVKDLSLDQSISRDIPLILVNGFIDSLSINEINNLTDYIEGGGNIILAQNGLDVEIKTNQVTPILSNIFNLLNKYGLKIEQNLVLDKNCAQVGLQRPAEFMGMRVYQTVPTQYPFIPILQNFNTKINFVKNLEVMSLRFPSEINFDSSKTNYTFNELFKTSNSSSTMTEFYNLDPNPDQNPSLNQLNKRGKIVGAISTFLDTLKDLSSSIVLVSDKGFLTDDGGMEVNTRTGGFNIPQHPEFILNTVDHLVGDSDLIALRSREITTRPLNADAQDVGVKSFWKKLNYFLPALLILLFAFFKARAEKGRTHKLEYMYE